MITASRIVGWLNSRRLRVSTEAQLQEDIWTLLTMMASSARREVRLAPGERIDFMVDGVGIEAKTKCGKRAIYRQLERYARHEGIRALILVTATALGLPREINGKPVFYVSLGRAAL